MTAGHKWMPPHFCSEKWLTERVWWRSFWKWLHHRHFQPWLSFLEQISQWEYSQIVLRDPGRSSSLLVISNIWGEGNTAADVLSTVRDDTSGYGTADMEDGTSSPDVRLVGGTGVRGAGAAGTDTVAFATVAADLFAGACLVGARPFTGSSAWALQVPEAEKWSLRFLLDPPFGIFRYFCCVASLGT